MVKNKAVPLFVIVWFVSLASVIGVHSYLKKKPRPREYLVQAHAIIQGLDEPEKVNISHFEAAVIRIKDGTLHLIGTGYEKEEDRLLSEDVLFKKKIEFRISDRLRLERQMMATEAFRWLNNAEKKCLEDGYASILFSRGEYSLIIDKAKYLEYVAKYGTKCEQCDGQESNSTIIGGGE